MSLKKNIKNIFFTSKKSTTYSKKYPKNIRNIIFIRKISKISQSNSKFTPNIRACQGQNREKKI